MADQARAPSEEGFAARWAAVVPCWMCGIRLQQAQMMPDGGGACGDIRWYCRDTRACTERWTSTRRQERAAEVEAEGGDLTAPRHPAPSGLSLVFQPGGLSLLPANGDPHPRSPGQLQQVTHGRAGRTNLQQAPGELEREPGLDR